MKKINNRIDPIIGNVKYLDIAGMGVYVSDVKWSGIKNTIGIGVSAIAVVLYVISDISGMVVVAKYVVKPGSISGVVASVNNAERLESIFGMAVHANDAVPKDMNGMVVVAKYVVRPGNISGMDVFVNNVVRLGSIFGMAVHANDAVPKDMNGMAVFAKGVRKLVIKNICFLVAHVADAEQPIWMF